MITTSAEPFDSVRQSAPDLLVRGRAVKVSVELDRDGKPPTITAATVTLFKPDGTKLVDAAAATISGGVASYTIPAATLPTTLTPLGEGYQLLWSVTIDGIAHPIDREAAVIRVPLRAVISDADIEDMYPDISVNYGKDIDGLLRWRREAWRRVVNRLLSEGHLPYLIKSASAFRVYHIEKTCELFYRFLAKQQQSRGAWMELSREHREAAETAWSTLNFTVDRDHDGKVDDPHERVSAEKTVHFNGAPTIYYPSGL